MMRDVDLAERLKADIENRRQMITETLLGGGLSDMEQYRGIQGQLTALSFMEEILREHFREK